MSRITTEQAFNVIAAARAHGNECAVAQALAFAAAVAHANASHLYSGWSKEEEDDVFFLGGNPDLVTALGHNTAERWLEEQR